MWLLLLLGGCVTFDWAIFNGVPCGEVGPATCEDKDNDWDRICIPCDQDYPWDRDYDWIEGTVEPGQTVRPIDPDTVQRTLLPTDDGAGDLDVYLIPAHGDDPDKAALTILYNHGNYASLDHYLPRVRFLHEAGYQVVTWDYRGYGKTTITSNPTPEQFFSDARRVRDWVAEQGIDAGSVAVYGYSLGGLPAVEMARTRDQCALLLEAPFTSLDAIIAGNTKTGYPAGLLTEGLYDNDERIADYDGPLLVMSGTEDRTFPPEDIEVLVENAGGETEWWLLEGVHHGVSDGGVPEAGLTPYFEHMDEFLSPRCPLP